MSDIISCVCSIFAVKHMRAGFAVVTTWGIEPSNVSHSDFRVDFTLGWTRGSERANKKYMQFFGWEVFLKVVACKTQKKINSSMDGRVIG